jgi:trehalose 6-phosphate synthase/phosphatase
MRGVSKGMVAQRIQAEGSNRAVLVAIGDDRTDEDLFRALPAGAISIAVGRASAAARFHVDHHVSVRRLLSALVDRVDDSYRAMREAVSA